MHMGTLGHNQMCINQIIFALPCIFVNPYAEHSSNPGLWTKRRANLPTTTLSWFCECNRNVRVLTVSTSSIHYRVIISHPDFNLYSIDYINISRCTNAWVLVFPRRICLLQISRMIRHLVDQAFVDIKQRRWQSLPFRPVWSVREHYGGILGGVSFDPELVFHRLHWQPNETLY